MLTQKYLKSILHYDKEIGVFTWLKPSYQKQSFIGKTAGTISAVGYIAIGIDAKIYSGHRLAFLYMTGEMPTEVDHINRDPSDNRWSNLRSVTKSQNSLNRKMRPDNTSGYRGVVWHKRVNQWQARINVDGNRKHLGYFTCKHHAFCEYVLAARKHLGEFSPV